MAGPYTDIRVLDFSRDMAGRYATMMMADMGAEVIRVESPDAVANESNRSNRLFDRGKKSIFLDLSSPEGMIRLTDILKSADMLFETWLVSEAKSAFLDYETVSKINPFLIYCSTPPYGDTGPMAEIPGDDGTVGAFTGIHEGQGGETGTPLFVRLPLVSYGTAFSICLAGASALLERNQSGIGQNVTVPLYSGSAIIQATSFIDGVNVPAPRKRPPSASGGLPTYRLYKCSDDWLFMACGNNVFWNKMCIALEQYEFLEDERFTNAPWGISMDDWHVISEVLEPLFASNTREHWLKVLHDGDVPCGPAETREWFKNHPQAIYNGMMATVEDPILGLTEQPGPPIEMSESVPAIQGPAPIPGSTNVINVSEKSPNVPSPGTSKNHPLEGIKIIDLTGYIAGSYGTRLLANLGAEVLKIESFAGDGFRQNSAAFQGWNQGKQGMILNLKDPEGLGIFHDLIKDADIVAENFRGGIAKRLKVDYEDLQKINPSLIYSTVTGYGSSGPSSHLPTFDPLIQAQGGAMRDQGGDGDPVFLRVAASDYSSAILSAFGMVSALYHRDRTGNGQRVEVSLVNSAFAYQAAEYFDYPGKKDETRLGSVGHSADYRLYKASDGWIFLSCKEPSEWLKMCKALGQDNLSMYSDVSIRIQADTQLNPWLEAIFATGTVSKWITTLRGHDVKCSESQSITRIHKEPQAQALGLLTTDMAFGELGEIRTMGIPFQFSRTSGKLDIPAPDHGEHTDEILDSLGFDNTQIFDFRERGIVG